MGLKFAPLAWTYHDAWNWRQSKILIGEQGRQTDASKTCHQRGHVHLFLPTVEYSPSGSSLAYWGEQTYSFNVVDEWGPNSNDPSQNQSVRLVGKPLWYLYVEEYWRRMYIQPWDVVDETCTLPMNQEITYTKRNLEEYYHQLLSKYVFKSYMPGPGGMGETETEIDLHLSMLNGSVVQFTDCQLDGRNEDGTIYNLPSYRDAANHVGFNDYFTQRRRHVARLLFVHDDVYGEKFMTWLASLFRDARYDAATKRLTIINHSTSYGENKIMEAIERPRGESGSLEPYYVLKTSFENDTVVIDFIYAVHTATDTTDGQTTTIQYNHVGDFEKFVSDNMARYAGYVDMLEALEQFMGEWGVKVKDGCRMAEDGTILVPNDETKGHVGIRFDASKPCHSLGPFMEGGEFYFFNTVVNRSMPCEYWLDDAMKTRQYFIKQGWNGFAEVGKDTSGGQTWTFSGDNSKFIWVQNTFAETSGILEDGYETDTREEDPYYYDYSYTRRLPDLYPVQYVARGMCFGMNAKRLKDAVPTSGDCGARRDNHLLDNTMVPQERYSSTVYDGSEGQEDGTQTVTPVYTENGVVLQPESSSSSSSQTEPLKTIQWELGGWTGWYDNGEIVRCAVDGEWYRRTWSPMQYSTESPFSGTQPFWNVEKRQNFPNPSPWLCDSADGSPRYSTEPVSNGNPSVLPESIKGVERQHWCTDTRAYEDDEETRIHLLHWEYAMYFGLARRYPVTSPSDERMLRKHFFIYSDQDDRNPSSKVKFYCVNMGEDGEYKPPHSLRDEQEDGYIPYGPDYLPDWCTQGNLVDEVPADIETLMEEYADDNDGYPTSIETENSLFTEWISSLGKSFFMRFEDRDIRWYSTGTYAYEITDCSLNQNGRWDIVLSNGRTYTVSTLPELQYSIAGMGYMSIPTIIYGNSNAVDSDYRRQTYVMFDEFRKTWTPIDDSEKRRIGLFGDMPQRNGTPYGGNPVVSPTDIYPELDESNPLHGALRNGEEQKKRDIADQINDGILGERSPSMLISEFFPRIDQKIREYNASKHPNQPSYTPSPLDEAGDSVIIENQVRQWDSLTLEQKKNYLQYYTETGTPIDPYRNGKVNPIDTWKKYFDHREVFTIPEGTVAGGDAGIANSEGSPNFPYVHPREASFSHEDGARRHYPEDMFLSPVIEYQKIIRKNYERPTGKEHEEEWLNTSVDGKPNWKTDTSGDWGDGFDITVTIPWKERMEIQSPFSEDDHVTKPIGEYCHDCVKPEDMLRHHIEFYDSLAQVRKYDFPNYVRMIHAFQKECMPTGENTHPSSMEDTDAMSYGEIDQDGMCEVTETMEDGSVASYSIDTTDFSMSFYKEDFNDYERTERIRKDGADEGLDAYNRQRNAAGLASYATWQDALDEYWTKINGNDQVPRQDIYVNMPVMRSCDCHGNKVVENAFERLDDGTLMWREQTTALMPSRDKIEYLEDNATPGYIDSNGNHVKGGGRVKFNNPYPEHSDGKWYEECLGAIVKARCVLVLEDALGYRWKQVVEATALQPDQPIRGSDYDG